MNRADSMEMIRIIFFCRRISPTFLRDNVHNDRSGKLFRPFKLEFGGHNVVTVNGAGVFNSQVGKHYLFRRNHIGHSAFNPMQGVIGEFSGFTARLKMLFTPT